MIGIIEEHLLNEARLMPEMQAFLLHMDALRDLLEAQFGLELNPDTFMACALREWPRHRTPDLLSIEPIALTAIVERAAGIALPHGLRIDLREAIGRMNARLAAEVEGTMSSRRRGSK